MKTRKFQIKWFDDYHSIDFHADQNKMKGFEIGAFFRKGLTSPGQLVYWGVFWKSGKRPAKAEILKALKPMIAESDEFPLSENNL